MSGPNPLVSIIVITYNSAQYVLETLDSAKAQTYENIELIITDDGSKDNTVELCRVWLQANMGRFIHTELITVETNTGIPANCNRGVKAAKGEWIKLIAGDDAFFHSAIYDFILNVKDELIVQTNQVVYKNFFLEQNIVDRNNFSRCRKFFLLAGQTQFKVFKHWNFVKAPSVFISRELLNTHQFDEEFKIVEDYPYWIKMTSKNISIRHLNVFTVKYRIYDQEVKYAETNLYILEKRFFKNLLPIRKKYFHYSLVDIMYEKIKIHSKRNLITSRLFAYFDFIVRTVLLNYYATKPSHR